MSLFFNADYYPCTALPHFDTYLSLVTGHLDCLHLRLWMMLLFQGTHRCEPDSMGHTDVSMPSTGHTDVSMPFTGHTDVSIHSRGFTEVACIPILWVFAQSLDCSMIYVSFVRNHSTPAHTHPPVHTPTAQLKGPCSPHPYEHLCSSG